MKKVILVISMCALVAGAMFLNSCKKDDTTAPVVTITGSSTVTSSLNASYTDAGAKANDEKDGDLTSKITTTWSPAFNKDLKGEYVITYSSTDAAGNVGTATRTVKVVNDAEFLAGSFVNAQDTETSPVLYTTFDANVTTSNTVNNAFTIDNFSQLSTSAGIKASLDATGTNITFLLPQALLSSSSLTQAHGVVVSKSSPVKFEIIYQWVDSLSTTASDVAWYIR